ncbi:MAG: PfkB family carbohydrate kinase [Tenuifilaceae bacterium]
MVTTFGEILLRISPKNIDELITQTTSFRIEPGGSESNVAIALANLGVKTNFVTCLPDNQFSEIVLQHLKQFNVETKYIIKKDGRIGIYWTEIGIGPRSSFVIYDRENSVFSNSQHNNFNWNEILKETEWFHFSGISPGLSQFAANNIKNIIPLITVPYSVDLNFREKLWSWVNKDKIRINEIMSSLCDNAFLICGNETDFQNVFGFTSNNENLDKKFEEIALKCFERFRKAKYLAISNRISYSATQNDWSGYLFVQGEKSPYKGVTYTIDNIYDRVGTGDSFTAGIIYGLTNSKNYNLQETIDFAVTLSALNHTTRGDSSRFSIKDVQNTLNSKGSGRIIR